MPASSEKQRIVAAIALHSPSKLFKRNRGMLSMSKGQLREFSVKPVVKALAHKKGH